MIVEGYVSAKRSVSDPAFGEKQEWELDVEIGGHASK